MPVWPEASFPEKYTVHASCGECAKTCNVTHDSAEEKSVQLTDLVMTHYKRDRTLTQHLTIRKADSQETQ